MKIKKMVSMLLVMCSLMSLFVVNVFASDNTEVIEAGTSDCPYFMLGKTPGFCLDPTKYAPNKVDYIKDNMFDISAYKADFDKIFTNADAFKENTDAELLNRLIQQAIWSVIDTETQYNVNVKVVFGIEGYNIYEALLANNENVDSFNYNVYSAAIDSNKYQRLITLGEADVRYNVTYKVDGVQVGDIEIYDYNDYVHVREGYIKDGYTVSDWDITKNFRMPSHDVIINATSTINSYTVTYKVDDKIVGNVETYQFNQPVAIRDKFVKNHYNVSDWDITEDFTMPSRDVVINAATTPILHKVIYKVDGKPYGNVEFYKYEDFVSVRQKLAKQGFIVSDWSITDNFEMPDEDVVIEATSTKIADVTPDPIIDEPVVEKNKEESNPDIPDTGDNNIAIYIILLIISAGGIYFIRKQKISK